MRALHAAPKTNCIQIFFDYRQLAHQPALELHNGSWAEYAEKASRAELILEEFEQCRPPRDHGVEPIFRVHSAEYLEFLRLAHKDWLAAGTAIPGAALAGAAIDAAAGGVTSMLKDHGVSGDDAGYYEERINQGDVFVSVDAESGTVNRQSAEEILYASGGHSSARTKTEAVM